MSLTDIIASIALLLSIISLYIQWREKKLRLNVYARIEKRVIPVSDGHGEDIDKKLNIILVRLSNPGEKAIHVNSVYLLPKGGNEIEMHPYRQKHSPTIVEPHRAQEFLVRGPKIVKELTKQECGGLVQASVIVKDEIGNTFKSKPMEFFQDELMEIEVSSNRTSV